MDYLHNIKAVSMRTGLSAHVIRIWEKRYGAVTPARTASARRMYSEEDVARLALLSQLTQRGFSISNLVPLSDPELTRLLEGGGLAVSAPTATEPPLDEEALIDQALLATRNFSTKDLVRCLDDAMLQLGASGVLERMLLRFLRKIGELWSMGDLTASQEHFASAAIRDYLAQRVHSMIPSASAPRLVVGTPRGQLHELGAVISAALARKAGWDVIYLGPSLPSEELAHACLRNNASVLALSIIYPLDDPALAEDLQQLAKLLPSATKVFVGGPNLAYYESTLMAMNARIVSDLSAFSTTLRELREIGSASSLT
jgi:DNA-binding transcriptional MerR regulator/methylmalonyl-CoA mutase cobalamin-binding subunit